MPAQVYLSHFVRVCVTPTTQQPAHYAFYGVVSITELNANVGSSCNATRWRWHELAKFHRLPEDGRFEQYFGFFFFFFELCTGRL